jgi:hypothetical protein
MPKQPRFDKRSARAPDKKPVTGPVWLLLGLAAVLLAAMTRKASGCRPHHDKQTVPQGSGTPPVAACGLSFGRAGLAAAVWRASAGSRGSYPRPLGRIMGGRLDRTGG